MSNKYISDYVYLAEASYADFSGTYQDDKTAIINTKPDKPKPAEFAQLVTENYTVEAHWKDGAGDGWGSIFSSESGFSATLFKGIGDGTDGKNSGYVLAMKGSLGTKDFIIADGGDIVLDGFALKQPITLFKKPILNLQ